MTDIAKGSSIEHPAGSGIRISVVTNRAKGKNYSYSFRVHVPNRITGKGRIQKQFPALEKAKAFAGNQLRLANRHGQAAFKMTEEQRVDAVRALEFLKGTNLTLETVAKYARPRLQPDNGEISVREVVERFLKRKAAANLRVTSINDLKVRTNTFCKHFGDCSISSIEKRHVFTWFDGLKLSQRGKLNYWRAIRQTFKWAKSNDLLLDDLFETISRDDKTDILGREDEKLIEAYTVEEAQLLLEAATGDEILTIWVIGFFCGLRARELFLLDWKDIRLDEKEPFVTVRPLNAKTRSLRNVEICPTASGWLSLCEIQQQGLVYCKSRSAYDRKRKKIHEITGVKKKDNGLRHSFGSYHYGMYGDEIRTATQMGHNPNDHSLFSNYRALVSEAAARSFWASKVPSNNKKLVQFPS